MILFYRTYGVTLIALSLLAIMGLSYPGNAADISGNVQWILLLIISVGLALGIGFLAIAEDYKLNSQRDRYHRR